MGKNVNEFLGLDNHGKLPDGTELTHQEKYEKIVNAIGLQSLKHLIPANKNQLAKAYAEDQHLNTIPLKLWDEQQYSVGHLMARHAGITSSSLAERVCVLKCAARMWIEEAE